MTHTATSSRRKRTLATFGVALLAVASCAKGANDDTVGVFLGIKQLAIHARSWGVGEDIEHPSHKQGLLEQKPRAAAASGI